MFQILPCPLLINIHSRQNAVYLDDNITLVHNQRSLAFESSQASQGL